MGPPKGKAGGGGLITGGGLGTEWEETTEEQNNDCLSGRPGGWTWASSSQQTGVWSSERMGGSCAHQRRPSANCTAYSQTAGSFLKGDPSGTPPQGKR